MQQKSFIRALPIFLAALAVFTASLFAQLSTGKVEGTVRDKDTGQPLQGAQVSIEGTRLGNVTNADGYYFILNVPPGRRDITFTYTGYQKTTVSSQLFLAGQTTTINASLSSTVVQLEGITVEGESEVLLPRDETSTRRRLTTESITETPATRLEDMMLLQAGVQTGGRDAEGRGLRIRGGRLGEEGMVVDGVMVRNYTANPFRGGQGWIMEMEIGSQSDDATPLEFSTSAVEEVDIITGGFQAEYGNAQSGIINIVTKEGGPQLKGDVRFTTDELNPRTADWGYNQLMASISGPIKVVPNLYFHIGGEIQGMADNFPTHADEGFRGINQDFVDRLNDAVRNDPVLGERATPYTLEMFKTGRESYASRTGKDASLFMPPNPVRLPHNWYDRTLTSAKLTYSPIEGMKLIATNNWSRNQNSYPQGYVAEGNYFNTGTIDRTDPSYNFLYGNLFDLSPYWTSLKGPVDVIQIHMGYGRRVRTNNMLLGADWDFYRSANRSGMVQVRFMKLTSQQINHASLRTNWERDTFMSWSVHDLQFEVETWPGRDGLNTEELRRSLLPDGESGWKNYVPYETPFDVRREALYYMSYGYLREDQKNYKVDLDFQLNRSNRAKLGFQLINIDNHRFTQNYYTERRDPRNEFLYHPRMYAGYVQNRTDLGDFVFDYGIRYDGFEHRTNWGITALDEFGERVRPMTHYEWSPRFDVAFPVTDKAQLRFSYGVFTQLPSMDFLFAGSSGGSPFMNPGGLEYSRTDAFESGLSYLLGSDMVLDVVAFYRDVDGNVATKSYFNDYYAWHKGYRVREWAQGYVNRDNGNIKGVDFTLRKRFSNNFAFTLMYTLQFSRTTGSAYNQGSWIGNFDATSNEIFVPPDYLAPISGDRTHQVSYQFNYLFPEDFRAGTMAGTILRNFRTYAVLTLQSGTPLLSRGGSAYTGNEDPALTNQYGGLNAFRGRWYVDLNLRFSKGFSLGKARRVRVFAELFNALNRKSHYAYPKGYRLENYSHLTGGVDLDYNNVAESDFARVRFNADFNNDGILTVEESAMGGIAADFMMSTMDKRLWGRAREIRSGLEFTF
ncbi:MAG TPA: carboxypeptidase-like regulatory domain-containing protein [archaeon]|nr:carboxypeptidase-like regulatory domain-containing protein [archaeon]